MNTVYVSGPMRGIPKCGFDVFDEVAAQLGGVGYYVFNPADHDREVYPNIESWAGFADGDLDACPEFDYHAAIAWDLRKCIEVDIIVMLPGWETSTGARHERYMGEVCGKRIVLAEPESWGWTFRDDPLQHRVSILEAARNMPAEKRTFDTGATRDASEHKPDPEGFWSPVVIRSFNDYMHGHRAMADGSLRDSDNWQKGMPLDAYMKSLWRHFLDVWTLHRGHDVTDYDGERVSIEQALNGVLFNTQGYLHEVLKPKPHATEHVDELGALRAQRALARSELLRVDL